MFTHGRVGYSTLEKAFYGRPDAPAVLLAGAPSCYSSSATAASS